MSRMRLHIDDLSRHVGKSLGTGEWTEVTQARVSTFTDAADDHQWIHTDAERAKTGPFGGPIAHGFLTLSLFIPMFEALLDLDGVTTKINYGLNRVRFPAPVPVGSRIRLTATLNASNRSPATACRSSSTA